MILYYVATAVLMISFFINKNKTKNALKIALKKLMKIAPTFFTILISVSVILTVVPEETISNLLQKNNNILAPVIAALLGAVTFMPGPIVYPLCRILLNQGVSYSIIAAFSTSLMMVGVMTFPLEKKYFGTRFAILRNLTAFFMSLIIAFVFALLTLNGVSFK